MSQTTEKRDVENVLRRLVDIQTTLEKVLGEVGKKVTEELGTNIPEIRKILETTLEKVPGEGCKKVTDELDRRIPDFSKILETTLKKVLGEEGQKVTDELSRIIPEIRKIVEEKDRRIRELEMGKATVESQSQPTDDPNKTKEQSGEKEPAKPETRDPKLSSDDAGKSMETEIDWPEGETPTAKSSSPSTDDPNGTKEQSSKNNLGFFSNPFEYIKHRIKNDKKETSCSSSTKPKKSVQINDPTNTKSSMKFASTLTEKLKNDFNCLTINTEGVENGIPLIVVCISSTRLKPDVEFALSKVSYSAKCVVLIVHTGAESNLPAVPSSQKLGRNWTNVEFIDMGFDVDYGGIYNCCHNEIALRRLSEYINDWECV